MMTAVKEWRVGLGVGSLLHPVIDQLGVASNHVRKLFNFAARLVGNCQICNPLSNFLHGCY